MKNDKYDKSLHILKIMLSDDGEILLVGTKPVDDYILQRSQMTPLESIIDFKIQDFIQISAENELNIITPFRRVIEGKIDSKLNESIPKLSHDMRESQKKKISVQLPENIEDSLKNKSNLGSEDILRPLNELIDFENQRSRAFSNKNSSNET